MAPDGHRRSPRPRSSLGRERLRAPTSAYAQAPAPARAAAGKPDTGAVPPEVSGSLAGRRRRGARRVRVALWLTRYALPSVVVLAGIVAMTFGTQTSLIGGGGLIGAGLSVALISWLYRLGTESDEEREAEDRARRYFARYGRWPN